MNATAAAVAPSADARTTSKPLVMVALAVALAGAASVRFALAWAHATPDYFPDEYRYAAIARSFATLHSPRIHGAPADFPALLYPLLTAPAWRVGSLETAYRLVQAIGSLAFTLAAVPAFLLARQLRLSRSAALAVATATLLVPDGLYAGFVLSEPIAYPLLLAAVATGVPALARPSRRRQLAFFALAGLAAAARIQFVVLPACYLVAAVAIGLREHRLRRTLQEQWVILGLAALALVAVLAKGPGNALGFYSGVLHLHVHAASGLDSFGRNLLVLAFASGWIIVPGALLGLLLALVRPRSRTELAFGSLLAAIGAALVLEASVLGEPESAQERYVFYVVPLLALAFCLYASRGWPLGRVHALLAGGMLLIAGIVPLSNYARPRFAGQSPFLIGVRWLEAQLGNGDAALAVALAAAAMAAMAAAAAWKPRIGTAAVLAIALAFSGLSYGAAWAFDRANTAAGVQNYLASDRSWVDHAQVGSVTLVTSAYGSSVAQESQLFWNRSVSRATALPQGASPDDRPSDRLAPDPDGTLRASGRPLSGPLLVDERGSTVVFRNAERIASATGFTLWSPHGAARLALYMPGRFSDGWLAPLGEIAVWPRDARAGIRAWMELRLRGPETGTVRVTFRRHGFARTFTVAAGDRLQVRIPACSARGPWSIGFDAPRTSGPDGRLQSITAGVPRLVPAPGACSSRARHAPPDTAPGGRGRRTGTGT
jgi:hypothetical protein